MKWQKDEGLIIPIKSWCAKVEPEALKQAMNLARHPALLKHVALMPDCHVGYGMPIGGVIAADNALIPNAVGVDIGCGMIAVETNLRAERFASMSERRALMDRIKNRIPLGEGRSHNEDQEWDGFEKYLDTRTGAKDWPSRLDRRNLGTLGGGNHFIELQVSKDGFIWLMIHSGSRNLGYRIASMYHAIAKTIDNPYPVKIPHMDLAFLPADTAEGNDYFTDMTFALEYALENRKRMMSVCKEELAAHVGEVEFKREVNIHHNYAALETHFGKQCYIHRKGATSAKDGEIGIIPGSMGTTSYIVQGLGNQESFMSCSHGAGRIMGRTDASQHLSVEACDKAMEGIVHDRWNKYNAKWGRKNKLSSREFYDLSEAPLAYKNIEEVIESELDLITPIVKLRPLAVLKG